MTLIADSLFWIKFFFAIDYDNTSNKQIKESLTKCVRNNLWILNNGLWILVNFFDTSQFAASLRMQIIIHSPFSCGIYCQIISFQIYLTDVKINGQNFVLTDKRTKLTDALIPQFALYEEIDERFRIVHMIFWRKNILHSKVSHVG